MRYIFLFLQLMQIICIFWLYWSGREGWRRAKRAEQRLQETRPPAIWFGDCAECVAVRREESRSGDVIVKGWDIGDNNEIIQHGVILVEGRQVYPVPS